MAVLLERVQLDIATPDDEMMPTPPPFGAALFDTTVPEEMRLPVLATTPSPPPASPAELLVIELQTPRILNAHAWLGTCPSSQQTLYGMMIMAIKSND